MANTIKPTGNNAIATPANRVTCIDPDTVSEQLDYLTAKLTQLSALLEHTYGESGEAFRSMNDGPQENYLWLCADMVRDCCQATATLHDQYLAECKAARKIGGAA
jgi:hypothetical protein